MKTVVFLFGVPDYNAPRTGEAISDIDFAMITGFGETLGVNIIPVFAIPDKTGEYAGRAKDVSIKVMREYRDEALAEIKSHKPKLVMACGSLPLKCLLNKGNAVMTNYMRECFTIPELSRTPCAVTQGLEMVAYKPGTEKTMLLDTRAALFGNHPTEWGDYKILLPGAPEWAVMPPELKGVKRHGFDLETYPGLDPWHPHARIRMCAISDREGRAWIVQARQDSKFPAWVRKLAEDPTNEKCGSNIKFDYRWMHRFGYALPNILDTSTAEHILDCTNPFKDLKFLTFTYVPKLGDYSRGHRLLVKERGGWEFVADNEQYDYCGGDGEASISTMQQQLVKLEEAGLSRPFKLSMGLYQVLAKMETSGACISQAVNTELDGEFEKSLNELRQRIINVLGPINPNSPDQLAEALIKYVPGIKLNKAKIQRQFSDGYYKLKRDEDDEDYSTQKAILEREASKHTIINVILQYRKYAKLHSTYVQSLRDKHLVTHPDGNLYVHTSYRTDVAETARLTSQNPNLQNIPRKPEPDDKFPIPLHLNIKRQFISRFAGGSILEADLSQAEIRIAAHLSRDPLMIEALVHGEDPHRAMSSKFLGKPEAEVTDLERTHGKRQNFLVIYGGGANTLSARLNIPKQQAKGMLDLYFRTFNKLHDYMTKCGDEVMVTLVSESEFGYRRRFREPPDWNQPEGWRIKRQAWNHRVQNGAACCVFVSMIDLNAAMEKKKLKSIIAMQVHDSLVIDVYPGEEKKVAKLAKYHLENPNLEPWGVKLTVPLIAELEIGPSWGEKKKLSA